VRRNRAELTRWRRGSPEPLPANNECEVDDFTEKRRNAPIYGINSRQSGCDLNLHTSVTGNTFGVFRCLRQ
jgi:hypothetical protein